MGRIEFSLLNLDDQQRRTLVWAGLAVVLTAFDGSVLVLALPAIAVDFHARTPALSNLGSVLAIGALLAVAVHCRAIRGRTAAGVLVQASRGEGVPRRGGGRFRPPPLPAAPLASAGLGHRGDDPVAGSGVRPRRSLVHRLRQRLFAP